MALNEGMELNCGDGLDQFALAVQTIRTRMILLKKTNLDLSRQLKCPC